jgi:hypothetical protein
MWASLRRDGFGIGHLKGIELGHAHPESQLNRLADEFSEAPVVLPRWRKGDPVFGNRS